MATKITKYDNPAQADFINTYVPLPLDTMFKMGMMKEEKYEKGASAVDATVAQLENINAISDSPDDEYRRYAINEMYKIRDEFSDKDLSDPFVIRQMNNTINSRISKEWINKMQASHAGWQRNQEWKMKLGPSYNPLLDEDPASEWNSLEMGEYQYFAPAEINRYDTAKDIFGDLKDSYIGEMKDGSGYWYGVSQGRINELIDSEWHNFSSSAAGQQLMKLYANQNKLDYKELISNSEGRETLAKGTLRDLGKEFQRQLPQEYSVDRRVTPKTTIPGSELISPGRGEVKNITRRDFQKSEKELQGEYDKAVSDLNLIDPDTQPDLYGIQMGEVNRIENKLSELNEIKEEAYSKASAPHTSTLVSARTELSNKLNKLGLPQGTVDKIILSFDEPEEESKIVPSFKEALKSPVDIDYLKNYKTAAKKVFNKVATFLDPTEKGIALTKEEQIKDALAEYQSKTDKVKRKIDSDYWDIIKTGSETKVGQYALPLSYKTVVDQTGQVYATYEGVDGNTRQSSIYRILHNLTGYNFDDFKIYNREKMSDRKAKKVWDGIQSKSLIPTLASIQMEIKDDGSIMLHSNAVDRESKTGYNPFTLEISPYKQRSLYEGVLDELISSGQEVTWFNLQKQSLMNKVETSNLSKIGNSVEIPSRGIDINTGEPFEYSIIIERVKGGYRVSTDDGLVLSSSEDGDFVKNLNVVKDIVLAVVRSQIIYK